MPVPTYDEITSAGIQVVRLARERVGQGYASSYGITNPISLKDLSNLSGGNAGGSGNSFPAINQLNPVSANFYRNRRPDGLNPLKMSEFLGYNQTLTRRYMRFAFSSSNSSTACSNTISATIYYHDGSGVYPVGGDRAYTTYGGFTPAPAGFYQLFDPDSGVSNGTWVEVLGGGGGFAGTVGNSGNC
tara:strand:+ start:399 stop:959 length:561 start_codon:yes stop_codon:yes gene_type:complete